MSPTATQAVPGWAPSGPASGVQPVGGHHDPACLRAGEHLRQEGVPVVHLAVDGDEGLARRDRARVDREAGKAGVGPTLHQPSAGRLEDVVDGPLHAVPFP